MVAVNHASNPHSTIKFLKFLKFLDSQGIAPPDHLKYRIHHSNTEFIIFNAEIIIFNAEFIIFNAEFIHHNQTIPTRWHTPSFPGIVSLREGAQMMILLLKNDDSALPRTGPFQWKNPDFLLKNPDFLLKMMTRPYAPIPRVPVRPQKESVSPHDYCGGFSTKELMDCADKGMAAYSIAALKPAVQFTVYEQVIANSSEFLMNF